MPSASSIQLTYISPCEVPFRLQYNCELTYNTTHLQLMYSTSHHVHLQLIYNSLTTFPSLRSALAESSCPACFCRAKPPAQGKRIRSRRDAPKSRDRACLQYITTQGLKPPPWSQNFKADPLASKLFAHAECHHGAKPAWASKVFSDAEGR